ncbi:methylenetetrahydrofolate reductase [Magnetospirillum gryphiswaldense]|uniref:Methylenetetrahydrofolate reductase n=2 Tax=Magnetospirillum gryphiswaldense TaxID=55518 RepID=V6F6G4_MAGGM|nr:methylenetetrahydrofolate reductase [Magnetospirillum gryphiswaldense]AVM76156.1 5,10-methylenetetrahydrofolate reductase [Magnetospirillum gryphiswaldense MSR-1]AVM80059.1 5,10-methylenetetrahydrofolate reductase [Magnetospirillum gryphiswaldense]CAM77407.1 5,10-methylenetetrahydrofolate reductase [Magnetospirillum gryphiswaldense MSR-1]CDK99886.1 5,10-methylenetetrahydrofolate reductase [Magnetospirillum gryphiswaldense MSR-1 v2]
MNLPIAAASAKPVSVSFEFFPPKTEKMQETLWECVKRLEPLAPSFVSVTYGAGGTTRERTHDTVVRIARESSLKPAAHLTCVGHSQGEVDDIARRYWDEGIRHIVALRGDAPEGSGAYQPTPGGYAYAVDLVKGLKRINDFEISVAAYPEMHPDAPNADFDLDNLKRKVDAGATRAITQYFFDVDVYRRFIDRVRAAGITVPVLPGILPVTNFAQVQKFSAACGASVPAWMAKLFEGLDNDPETRRLVAATVAAEQCRALAADGVTDFHFYTLNRADLAYAISHILGVRPKAQ